MYYRITGPEANLVATSQRWTEHFVNDLIIYLTHCELIALVGQYDIIVEVL